MKTHFFTRPPSDLTPVAACGRGRRLNQDTRHVTCGLCQRTDAFLLAKDKQDSERHEAFLAQVPSEVAEPWREGNIVCACKGVLFRDKGTSCMGHYQDWQCANCGVIASRLTERGMSF